MLLMVLLIFQNQNKNYIQYAEKRRNTNAVTQNLFSLLHISLNLNFSNFLHVLFASYK